MAVKVFARLVGVHTNGSAVTRPVYASVLPADGTSVQFLDGSRYLCRLVGYRDNGAGKILPVYAPEECYQAS